MAMSWLDGYGVPERQGELLREAEERRLVRLAREGSAAGQTGRVMTDREVEVRWGLLSDDEGISRLLELNGMPRWVAFGERFIVAEEDGEVVAALRYRTEPKRLVLGLLVADPWAGERRLAVTLYAGAVELAREMGAREVLAPVGRGEYLAEAGYRRRGRGWRLDATRPVEGRGELPAGGWRRVVWLLGVVATPFFRAFPARKGAR